MAEQAEGKNRLRVQVCHATPERQVIRDLLVEAGATIGQAIRQSRLLEEFPEIDPAAMRVGIHGKLKTPETVLRDGDRIEIYRPLLADPKEARRKRAARKSPEGMAGGER